MTTYRGVTTSYRSTASQPTYLVASRRRAKRSLSLLSALLVTLGLVAVGVVPASAATTKKYHASLGTLTATLTYQGAYPEAHGAVLTITSSGRVQYRSAVTSSFCGDLCWPQSTGYGGAPNPLQVVKLSVGAPVVILGLYSGGAHCCFIDEIFAPSTTTSYSKTEVFLGDPGAQLKKLPGGQWPVFVSADDSFAYTFTDYAASGLPVKILRFENHHVVIVTRHYRRVVSLDAQGWLHAFYDQASSHYADSVGVIAAWTADEYLLGRASNAETFLREQAAAGHLNSLLNPSVKGLVFVTQLNKFLHQRGY